jgi:hypothetical protein
VALDIMSFVDLAIAIGSAGLVVFALPTLLDKRSQIPRKKASIPTAFFLTYMIPFFYLSGLYTTMITLIFQAVVWWGIAIYRPLKQVVVPPPPPEPPAPDPADENLNVVDPAVEVSEKLAEILETAHE